MKRWMIVVLGVVAGCATTPAPQAPRTEPPAAVPAAVVPEPAPVAPSSVEPGESVQPAPGGEHRPGAAPARTDTGAAPPEPSPRGEPPLLPEHLSDITALAAANDNLLLNLYVGMPKVAASRIMDGRHVGRWTNPQKQQVLIGTDGKVYEVSFYLTREPIRGRHITENLMTPVIYRDDKVFSIGRYPLKKLRRSICEARPRTDFCP